MHGSSFASLNGNVSVIIGVYQKAGVCVCGGGEGVYEKIELHTCSQKFPPPPKKKRRKERRKALWTGYWTCNHKLKSIKN